MEIQGVLKELSGGPRIVSGVIQGVSGGLRCIPSVFQGVSEAFHGVIPEAR